MLALGVPGVPIAALLLAAMMIHGVTPGPLLINQDPRLFWGFIASMYVGNVILLILNLPLVGLFVNLLRVPYPVLYPLIVVCSILGVYAVNSSVVDVWIMLAMGIVGYVLRKLDFETAPIVLGAGARADDGAVAAPVARDVGRALRDLRDAAHLRDAARGGRGARDLGPAAVHHAVARLALAAARRDGGLRWPKFRRGFDRRPFRRVFSAYPAGGHMQTRIQKMEEGATVDLSVENGRLLVRPLPVRKYALSALLKKVNPRKLHGEVSTGKAVGREAW
jgi:antitoxin component of MazEF toxin-antitoxin module